jgi:hypothetical protein
VPRRLEAPRSSRVANPLVARVGAVDVEFITSSYSLPSSIRGPDPAKTMCSRMVIPIEPVILNKGVLITNDSGG